VIRRLNLFAGALLLPKGRPTDAPKRKCSWRLTAPLHLLNVALFGLLAGLSWRSAARARVSADERNERVLTVVAPVQEPTGPRRFRRLFGRRWVRVAAVAVGALALGGGVFAYFTATGSGQARASITGADPVTITAATPTTALYPGGSADVAATIDNPNPFPVHLPSLVLDTSQGTDNGFSETGAQGACDLSTLSFNGPQTDGGNDFVVPKKDVSDGTLDLDLPDALSMGTHAQTGCQGATFTVYLKVGS
jgi:hypothetical protein